MSTLEAGSSSRWVFACFKIHPMKFTRAYQPWITPTIFDNTGDDRVVDEWTFGQYVDNSTAHSVLKQHWDTWITENDFAQIAAVG